MGVASRGRLDMGMYDFSGSKKSCVYIGGTEKHTRTLTSGLSSAIMLC